MKYIVIVISAAIVSRAPQASDFSYGLNPASAAVLLSVPSGLHGIELGANGNADEEQAVPPQATYAIAVSASPTLLVMAYTLTLAMQSPPICWSLWRVLWLQVVAEGLDLVLTEIFLNAREILLVLGEEKYMTVFLGALRAKVFLWPS
ncbi:hypothetical protein NQ176_g200 [Zarea fungicola]|uniref:Uncharacterized protein n=1 Tax=Zarea fungicola TaxID=93591 RepID=A0ACC1NXS9_9HYPO|nr:hypothetical protein NQ176_g200 [Lecanicillium fungicola]